MTAFNAKRASRTHADTVTTLLPSFKQDVLLCFSSGLSHGRSCLGIGRGLSEDAQTVQFAHFGRVCTSQLHHQLPPTSVTPGHFGTP